MKKTLTTFAMIGFAMLLGSCKPKISNQTKAILNEIEGSDGVVNLDGSLRNLHLIQKLSEVATWDELCYIESADPDSRIEAFVCIMQKNPKYAKFLAINKMNELEVCSGSDFDVCSSFAIGGLRINILQKYGRSYGLSVQDSIAIDDAVLRAPYNKHIDYMDDLLNRLPPYQKNYSRLKELFFKEHRLSALRALARYRKSELCPIILKAAEGIVDDPMNMLEYQSYMENQNNYEDFLSLMFSDDFIEVPKDWSLIERFKPGSWNINYESTLDNYNRPEEVKKMALKCIYENPSPAFAKYQKEAEEYHKRIHEYYW